MIIRSHLLQAIMVYIVALAALMGASAETPNGFVTYSKGDAGNRELYLREMTVADGLLEEKLICANGDRGGDIQGVISFDGRFLAFSRGTGCAGGGYGGDDYHDFECWDVYIVRLDGPLPATPKKVAHGYWPSWSDDSYNATKTLYYSTHPEGTVRAVTVSSTGELSNDRLIHNVKDSWPNDFTGFIMAGPTGEWAAFRTGGVHIGHWAGPLAGQRVGGSGGCMPSVCADGEWVIAAHNAAQRFDGTYGGKIMGDGTGQYHYGTSTDMKWLVARTNGGWQIQNKGENLFLFKLTKTPTYLSTERQHDAQISDDGSWPDVHVGPLSKDVSINDFRAQPAHIATGNSATLMWNVWNATSLTINGDAVTGDTKSITPASTTDYTLTAEGENGPVSKTITVTVSTPELTSITLSPDQAVIAVNKTIDFSAATLDQSGNAFDSPISWSVSGGGSLSATSGKNVTFSSDGSAGQFTVTVQSGDLQKAASITITDPSALHLKINCGPNKYEVAGWENDDAYLTGGQDFSFGGNVATDGVSNPAPADVYKGVVHMERAGVSHFYDFPTIPNGTYTVRMHYNDGYAGDRKMNYKFDGEQLITDLDVDDEAGGTGRALVKELQVTILDGNGLTIECFGTGESDVFEAGIEIIGGSSTEPTSTIAISDIHTDQSYALGQEVIITWNASDDVVDVLIEVTVDGGRNWLPITEQESIKKSEEHFGAYPWTIPQSIDGTSLVSSDVRFRITDYTDGDVYDESGAFAITETATILQGTHLLSQNGVTVRSTPSRGIAAAIAAPGRYRIEVLDLMGRTLFHKAGAGPANIIWDSPAGAGTYILRVQLGQKVLRKTMILD